MKFLILVLFVFVLSLTFAGEKYGVYDLKGNRISTFEAEQHELPEKVRQVKSNNPHKKLYVSSLKKSKAARPTSLYHFKTGAYVEAARSETFSVCPTQEIEGTWISEHSISLNEKNCLSVQTPDLAGTFHILFMENSGLTDTVRVLVEQSYIQMGDYSHKIWVRNSGVESERRTGDVVEIILIDGEKDGRYESISYNQPLIVDKTKFTMGDAQYYSRIDSSIKFSLSAMEKYEKENLEKSKLPLVDVDFAWKFANVRSKKEGLDTAYYINAIGYIALDTSASGYRLPLEDEWFFLMRAGASSEFYWGDEDDPYRKKEDSLKISRYAWINPLKPAELKPIELKSVAQLLPNEFGLYDMVGIAIEPVCGTNPESLLICGIWGRGGIAGPTNYKSFRLLRKTPKLHKLEKF